MLALAQPAAAPPASTAPADAAAPAEAVREGVVRRIDVRGNERIEPATVISYLPIQVGETIDPAKIDLALKSLFRTDLFSDVRIDLQADGALLVTVEENPIINRVLFEGNKSMKEDKLKDEVSVRPRGIFTRSKVQSDVARIVELYRRAGRISANVTPQIVQLPQKRVDLIFKIDEGPKSGILRVNFLGNKAYSDNDLRDVVVTEQSRWYRFFSSNANYDPDRLDYDR
jgi:outer membrane protein insertion porin family